MQCCSHSPSPLRPLRWEQGCNTAITVSIRWERIRIAATKQHPPSWERSRKFVEDCRFPLGDYNVSDSSIPEAPFTRPLFRRMQLIHLPSNRLQLRHLQFKSPAMRNVAFECILKKSTGKSQFPSARSSRLSESTKSISSCFECTPSLE